MHILRILGATRVLGKSQGYFGLPIRDEVKAALPTIAALRVEVLVHEVELRSVMASFPAGDWPLLRKFSTLLMNVADALEVLELADVVSENRVDGPNTPTMVTAWAPTPDELALLNRGGSIQVSIVGRHHPPIMVSVGEVVK